MTVGRTVYRRREGWAHINLREIWAFREIAYILAWRDIQIRYKQTLLGAAWVIIQPLTAMLVFGILFGKLVKVPTDGVPYPLFVYMGILPWNYFSKTLAISGGSLVGNTNLITKVYFPRLIIPLSVSLPGLMDFAIASTALAGMMAYFGYFPKAAGVVMIPFLLLLVFTVTLGCGLWLSALNVKYRDFQNITPFLLQIGMFMTPIVYPASLVPERFRWILSLNPLTGIVEAFRAAAFGSRPIDWPSLLFSSAVAALIFVSGLFYFKRVERSFADII